MRLRLEPTTAAKLPQATEVTFLGRTACTSTGLVWLVVTPAPRPHLQRRMPNRCVKGPQDFHDSRVKAAVFPTLMKTSFDARYPMQSHRVHDLHFMSHCFLIHITLFLESCLPYANRPSQEVSLNFISSCVQPHTHFTAFPKPPSTIVTLTIFRLSWHTCSRFPPHADHFVDRISPCVKSTGNGVRGIMNEK